MPKINASYAKKLPVGEYSNETFSASIEAEVPTNHPDAARDALRRIFQVARDSVEEQFRARQTGHSNAPAQAPSSSTPPRNGTVPQNGRAVPATASQKKAIFAICRSLGVDHQQYGIDSLTIKQASTLIDELKSQQTGN